MKRKLHLAFLIALLFNIAVNAQDIIFQNPITGADPSLDNPFTQGQVTAAHVTASGIGRGPGLNYYAGSGANGYQANGYNTPTMDPTAYYEFTIAPDEGYAISYTTLQFSTTYSGAPSITPFVIRSSVDNYTVNIPFSQTNAVSPCIVNLAAFNEVEEAVTFRIFPFGSANPTDYVGIYTFTFRGTVSELLNTDNHLMPSFTAYPNPVNDILTLRSSIDMQHIRIYNMAGAMVIEKELNASEGNIDLSALQAGMYFAKLQAGNTDDVIKIIKQ